MSLERLSEFIGIMQASVLWALLPIQLQLLIIYLLVKPDGGDRPIGIFASFRAMSTWFRKTYRADWWTAAPRLGAAGDFALIYLCYDGIASLLDGSIEVIE